MLSVGECKWMKKEIKRREMELKMAILKSDSLSHSHRSLMPKWSVNNATHGSNELRNDVCTLRMNAYEALKEGIHKSVKLALKMP